MIVGVFPKVYMSRLTTIIIVAQRAKVSPDGLCVWTMFTTICKSAPERVQSLFCIESLHIFKCTTKRCSPPSPPKTHANSTYTFDNGVHTRRMRIVDYYAHCIHINHPTFHPPHKRLVFKCAGDGGATPNPKTTQLSEHNRRGFVQKTFGWIWLRVYSV